jgi:hypothetical protein
MWSPNDGERSKWRGVESWVWSLWARVDSDRDHDVILAILPKPDWGVVLLVRICANMVGLRAGF